MNSIFNASLKSVAFRAPTKTPGGNPVLRERFSRPSQVRPAPPGKHLARQLALEPSTEPSMKALVAGGRRSGQAPPPALPEARGGQRQRHDRDAGEAVAGIRDGCEASFRALIQYPPRGYKESSAGRTKESEEKGFCGSPPRCFSASGQGNYQKLEEGSISVMIGTLKEAVEVRGSARSSLSRRKLSRRCVGVGLSARTFSASVSPASRLTDL